MVTKGRFVWTGRKWELCTDPQKLGGVTDEECENTSGTSGLLPEEIGRLRFHFGAFFLPLYWGIAHRIWAVLLLLLIYPLVFVLDWLESIPALSGICLWGVLVYAALSLSFRVFIGFEGYKWGWRRRRFQSVQQFLDTQHFWSGVAWALVALGFFMSIARALR